MNTPESLQKIVTGRSSLNDWIKKKYPEFYLYLYEKYGNIDIKEQLYLYYHNLDSKPTCLICGKPTKFHGNTYGYAKYCCPTCAQLDENTRSKIKRTCIEKYGDDYKAIISNKTKHTKLVKYGDENYNNLQKFKQTCIERYGVDNPLKLPETRSKIKRTCVEKYGVEYSAQIPRQKNKIYENKDIIEWNKENNILICSCPDTECNKCSEKQYTTTYYSYYERKNIYHICSCTKKIPPYTNTTYKNTNIEVVIKNILDEYHIVYKQNIRSILPGNIELDFYIPDHKLAIECNGIYWHSSKFHDYKYHYNKFKLCEKYGIQLISLWEDQIGNKYHIIKSILLAKLNIYEQKIYARNCEIRLLDPETAKKFIDDNHLQGSINSSVRIGLYYKDDLVSVMTFGKKRIALGNSNTSGWELYRFCNKINTLVIGGASKLFKYFINTYNASCIESFSSNDISTGELYTKLGFIFQSESISYWYFKNKQRYHRYKFRKSELVKMGCDSNKTESQIMDEMGYCKIYDTGQKKWIYNI